MNDTERQTAGGIILTFVFILLLFTSKINGLFLIFILSAAITGFVLLTTGINYTPAGGISEMIPDGEYVFENLFYEKKNEKGEDILQENRSKVVQLWPEGGENVFGKLINWRVYETNDPDKILEKCLLRSGFWLRINNNVIEKMEFPSMHG